MCMLVCLDGFLRADPSTAGRGSRAEYISAPLQLTSTQCLSFRYQQANPTPDGNPELRIVIEEPATLRSTTVWRYAPDQTGWKSGRVTLRTDMVKNQLIQINFQALYGGNKTTNLQLDDIDLVAGECSGMGMYQN